MSFQLSDEQRAIKRAVREFGENEITPVAREHDEEKKYPREIVRRAAEYDLLAPYVSEEYGGAGMGALSSVLVTEELWRADPGIGGAVSLSGFGASLLEKYGSESLKEKWLPRITGGEAVCATAISEPAYGSNIAGMETRAERRNGQWVLNGNKMWITNGTVADFVIVIAKTDPGAGHEGISAFLVPGETEGFQPEKIDNKLGIRASDLAEIVLKDVTIPEENLIGEENRGFYQLMDFLTANRVDVGAQAVGAAQGALDAAVDYAGEREQFGQPIGEFQAIQHKIAEMATKVEAARSLTYRAAVRLEEDDLEMARRFSSMAKIFASERGVEVADDAVQVFGGAGYVSDHPVERYYRDVRITKIYEGSNEIQRNIIAGTYLS